MHRVVPPGHRIFFLQHPVVETVDPVVMARLQPQTIGRAPFKAGGVLVQQLGQGIGHPFDLHHRVGPQLIPRADQRLAGGAQRVLAGRKSHIGAGPGEKGIQAAVALPVGDPPLLGEPPDMDPAQPAVRVPAHQPQQGLPADAGNHEPGGPVAVNPPHRAAVGGGLFHRPPRFSVIDSNRRSPLSAPAAGRGCMMLHCTIFQNN